MIDLYVVVYDKLYHNKQDEDGQQISKFDQVSSGVRISGGV